MARIRSVPTMGFEGVQNVNYDNMLTATMFGEQAKLNASNQKNARIRQALADAEAERALSSENQAKFSALLNNNPDVLASMDEAPESVRKAFEKAMNGKASASDNAVVLAYAQASADEIAAENTRAIQELQLQAAQQKVSPETLAYEERIRGLNEELIEAQIDAQKSLATQRGAEAAETLSSIPDPDQEAAKKRAQFDIISGGSSSTPPAGLREVLSTTPQQSTAPQPRGDRNIPIDMSYSNAMEGQPNLQSRSPFVPEIQVQAVTPTEINPNDPYVLDASGNRVPMSATGAPMTGVDGEVAQLTQEAINNGSSPERAQTAAMAKVEVSKAKQNYLNKNTGNTRNLPTYGDFVAKLTALGQMDQDRILDLAKGKVEAGELYAAPSSEAVTEKADEFDKEYNTFTSKMNDLFEETADLSSTADKLYGEIAWTTVGLMGQVQTVGGLAGDFVPGGKSRLQVKLLVEALRGKGTMNAIVEAKEKGGGNTGLGQVSIPEFETLRAIKSQINQGLQGDDLRDAVQRFIYLQKRNALRMYEEYTKQYGSSTGLALPSVNRIALSSFAEDVAAFENDTEYGRNHRAKFGSTLPASFFAPAPSDLSQNNSMNQTNPSGETNRERFERGAKARKRNQAIGRSAISSAVSSALPGTNPTTILRFLDRTDPLMGDIELQ